MSRQTKSRSSKFLRGLNFFLLIVFAFLCVYPLYIDKFSNLGVTKFTGCFTLFLLFLLWLVACTAIGARAPRPRNANAGRDVTWPLQALA